MRDPRRLLLPLVLLVCAALPAPAGAQNADTPAEEETGMLDAFDGVMAEVNHAIAAVFFYDVGHAEHTIREDGELDDARLKAIVDQLWNDVGFNLSISNIKVELPHDTSEERLDAAASAVREAWRSHTGEPVAKSSQRFRVAVRDDPGDGSTSIHAYRDGIPLTVLWLVLGAIYFTVRMGFINLRGFRHAIKVVRGRYDNPEDEGEVSHFQALASALSATVGLGNIAGVAIAISVGGPGATFWMIVAGFLGMSSKFVECTLGQKYRQVRPDGRVMGGAMYYLSNGLAKRGFGWLGRILAVLFAILCIGGSFGGGNTFQVNQSLNALKETVPFLADDAAPVVDAFVTTAGPNTWVYGLIMSILVAIVIIGGIQRIAATAEKIVPLMCIVYVIAALFVILENAGQIPHAFSIIFSGAFGADALYGGFLGVLVTGFKRAAFSNEAGVGSAAIAHSAAKTEFPAREGVVAMLGPFIDTIIVCTMTALVIVITGAYDMEAHPEFTKAIGDANGAGLTSQAFGSAIPWFPYVLSVAVMMFAFSTMISWSYYGERCWAYLFGDNASMVFRVIFVLGTFAGSIITSQNVLEFGDLMILGMAFPNILGVLFLTGEVKSELNDYWGKLKRGELKEFG